MSHNDQANNSFNNAFGGGQKQPNRSGEGILELNNRLRRPMAKASIGEVVLKYMETFSQLAIDYKLAESGFKLLVLDGAANALAASAVVLVQQATVGTVNFAVAHTFLIEASCARLLPRENNYNGSVVETVLVAGDVFDATFFQRLSTAINVDAGMTVKVIEAGCTVIPSDMLHDDVARCRNLLQNATDACYTTLNISTGGQLEEGFQLSELANRHQLIGRIDYSPAQFENLVGHPVRGDILIELQGSIGQPDSGQPEQTCPLSKVACYIDLAFSAPAQPMMNGMNQQVSTQRYFPRAVITQVASEANAATLELQLLALSSAILLSRKSAWAGQYTSMPYEVQGPDLRDIGAVGYELNLSNDPTAKPAAIDTKAENFTTDNLWQLLGMAVHDTLIYSMDVEERGGLSWINQAFIAAAQGIPEANTIIIAALDRLTNGIFSKVFTGGPLVINDNNRIHLGYYTHPNGERRDIRDLDYLAMLNLVGKDDLAAVQDWGNTYDQTDVPMDIRLDKRHRVLKHCLGGCTITGYARRITFTPALINALNLATAEAGLVVRPQNMIQSQGNGVRGVNASAAYAVGAINTGMYSQQSNFINPNQQQNGYGGFGGVWFS